MRIQKFNQIEHIDRLAKIIFFNFIELQNQQDIVFNIDDIMSTLKSNNLLGWFLLDDNGKIIGYIVGELKELTDGRYVYYISYFYVIVKYRSMGLGFKMMLECIKYITSINVPFIMLISNIHSKAFTLYKQLGFGFDPLIKINNPEYSVLLLYTNQ
jgi:ribosomal protein S18 acetylase RimI-like enzyme